MRVRAAAGWIVLLTLGCLPWGPPEAWTLTSQRPAGSAGTVIVPDRFLRAWDPVTIFYDHDVGPPQGGAEDAPSRWVQMEPAQPGAFAWLDARTLQFRPADPWPPLARFQLSAEGKRVALLTLLSPPTLSEPRSGAQGLEPVEVIRLVFAQPLDPEALRSILTLELRPLPGLGGTGGRFLRGDDFRVRALDRKARAEAATYLLELAQPIPAGTRAVLHFRLSLESQDPEGALDLSFSTAESFRVVGVGCAGQTVPISSAGMRYGREQPLRCGGAPDEAGRGVLVEFSAPPATLTPVEARNLVRLDPPLGNFDSALGGRTLEIHGDFARETLYRVTIAPAAIRDDHGRPLQAQRESEVYLYFPRREPFLRWAVGQGIVERLGPQAVPVEGRGHDRLDLRIHAVDPLDRSFWPFPEQPVAVDESQRPPGPGEEREPWSDPAADPPAREIAARLRALGSPAVSSLVDLPLRRDSGAAHFGLDLRPSLERIAGKQAPGTYLVGIRRLDRSGQRDWMRVQVTDLAVIACEEPDAVVFTVTSLASAQAVAGATVRVEGSVEAPGEKTLWQELFSGTTDAKGQVRWNAPGETAGRHTTVRRLLVRNEGDSLVLDPQRPPDAFHDGQWRKSDDRWLGWTHEALAARVPEAETLAHIFTERPVYRPEETVHIKGYLRQREHGSLAVWRPEGAVVVTGPGDLVFRFPAEVTSAGSFYQAFTSEEPLPTGVYSAFFEDRKGRRHGEVSFRMEAYRIPRFEVQLQAPDRVPLDKEFAVGLTATYYAGGRVAARPIQWRVTQFPHAWTPKARPGFLYSSDGRYSRSERFESTSRLEKQDTTDAEGAARLALNPALEPTAQPRSYVVEATVTGEDDQTVTATREVIAVPPFVLGLKIPRYLERAEEIAPEVLAAGVDGNALAGQEITVRLLRRQWHSVLRASDFSEGVARYLTDVVDEKVAERKVTSGADPSRVVFPISEAGVYVVEVESADRLGRLQVVTADLYAGPAPSAATAAMAWAKPQAGSFTVSPDKVRYEPGDTAHLVLQSPFQKASALAIVEAPDGNRYEWLPVAGAAATFHLPILGLHAPRLPVHFVLLRGRLPNTTPQPGSTTDLGKPATVATTVWLEVEPTANRLAVELKYPEKARPRQRVDIEVRLQDATHHPLPGEVTLWLVDQAVLALGREQRLDPVPDFLRPMASRLEVRDSRNLAFGFLPFAETPGGEAAEREPGSLLERATVRRSFSPVPYYNPLLHVGEDGIARVAVDLPDNLTNFKLRAKAVAGGDRFGFATGQMAVRLPVIVQPALPRFVRPGDRFLGAAIGRVVEGAGGAGRSEIAVQGVRVNGPLAGDLQLLPNQPQRIEFPVEVPTPPLRADGSLAYEEAVIKVAVERTSDRASDAVETRLPIRDDRRPVTVRSLKDLPQGATLALPGPAEPARPGSVRRSVTFSDQPALLRMAAALDFLRVYPYGCTEQRLSTARAELAVKKFREVLRLGADNARTDRAVGDTLAWLPSVVDRDGLCSFWPGGDGSVWLTAWAAQFLGEAKAAGYPIDAKLLQTLTRSLEQAMRSDFGHFLDGESWSERSAALVALTALGKGSPSYAAELARQADFLNLESAAGVLRVLDASGASAPAMAGLSDKLRQGIVTRLHQGHEVYGGLQEQAGGRNPRVLPSETRTLAEVVRALAHQEPAEARFALALQALVGLGREDGWGNTNTNAAALQALAEVLSPPFPGSAEHTLDLRLGAATQTLNLGPQMPLASFAGSSDQAGEVRHSAGQGAVGVRVETSYLPAASGSEEAASASGFVVSREWLRVRGEDVPLERAALQAGGAVELGIGDVVEEHVQVVNPQERHFVAIEAPLAAGVEPLNAALATASAEAAPRNHLSRAPSYVMVLDDRVTFFYDDLPKGTFDFYFRTRATTAGTFIQPAARADLMYDAAVRGNSVGTRVTITRKD